MHIVEMQNRFYGLSVQDLWSIAYELAVQNGVKHTFSDQRKLAGKLGQEFYGTLSRTYSEKTRSYQH